MMQSETIFNIVFVVAHPDDEAIWIGGLLSELYKLDFIRAHLICLTQGRISSTQANTFRSQNYLNSYLGSESPEKATEPLQDIRSTLEKGLSRLSLTPQDISVLITHSPYGDEHGNPHHKQIYRELHTWTKDAHVPFGYFSSARIPYFDLRPIRNNLRHSGSLYLLCEAVCKNNVNLIRRWFSKSLAPYHTPARYLEFISTGYTKQAMIQKYEEKGEEINGGYTAAHHGVESLYLLDETASIPFQAIIEKMKTPGRQNLFPG